MSALTTWLDARLYPGIASNWDDELFRTAVLKHLGPTTHLLDFGAGRGNVEQMNFKGIAGLVVGLDPEPAVFDNPFLDRAELFDIRANRIPLPDASFDVVIADNVLEHVGDPLATFKEIHRVLKPGGRFLAKTPNRWHYMPLIARLTPTWFHRYYNRLRGRETIDTFPTLYRCNTDRAVRQVARACGFMVRRMEFIEGRPEYLRLFALSYLLGFLYERTVNSATWLAHCRSVMMIELRRFP